MGIPNLKDNTFTEDFKLENFIDLTEVKEFENLPGIKDIVFKIEEIMKAIGDFANKIMAIVKQVLSAVMGILDLFNVDALKKLFGTIFDIVGKAMSGFGFSAATRESMRNPYVTSCLNFNSDLSNKFNFGFGDLLSLTLIGVLAAMFCNGQPDALNQAYALFKDKEIMEEGELKELFGGSIGTLMTIPNENSIQTVSGINNAEFKDNILLNNSQYVQQTLTYLNADTTTVKNKHKAYDDVLMTLSSVDDRVDSIDNLKTYRNTNKFSELAEAKNLSKINTDVITNHNEPSGNFDLSILALC